MVTTASPRLSKARRTLRTACGLQPTAWAMTGAVSPRAEAKRMWQRRTVNPSDERRPACKAWRSGSLNSRTKRGFIPSRCHTLFIQTTSPETALVAADLRRDEVQETGRHGLPAEAVLRCALLKQYRQLSYEELAFHLEDSASFRAFARLPWAWS